MTWRARLKRWNRCDFAWRVLAPTGDALPAMFLHRCGILADANCAVVFGGSSIHHCFNDGWAVTLDAPGGPLGGDGRGPGVHVRRLRIAADSLRRPSPRSACSLVAVGSALYLFGGSGRFGDFFEDLWRLELTPPLAGGAAEGAGRASVELRYTDLSAAGPCGRWGHVGVGHLGKMWVFGGTCPGEAFSDLWCFDPGRGARGTWVEVRPGDDAPPEGLGEGGGDGVRLGTAAAGVLGAAALDSEGSWATENSEESSAEARQKARRPAGRGGHAACVVGPHMYVHGGNTVEASFCDCWRVNLTALNAAVDAAAAVGSGSVVSVGAVRWQELRLATAPPARIGHTMIAMGNRIIL
jgi:hypothetical protein